MNINNYSRIYKRVDEQCWVKWHNLDKELNNYFPNLYANVQFKDQVRSILRKISSPVFREVLKRVSTE